MCLQAAVSLKPLEEEFRSNKSGLPEEVMIEKVLL
jgi:hypothetical protein